MFEDPQECRGYIAFPPPEKAHPSTLVGRCTTHRFMGHRPTYGGVRELLMLTLDYFTPAIFALASICNGLNRLFQAQSLCMRINIYIILLFCPSQVDILIWTAGLESL